MYGGWKSVRTPLLPQVILAFNRSCLKPHLGPQQTQTTSLWIPRSHWDPHISILLPIQPYFLSGLSLASWKHQDSTFSSAHSEPYRSPPNPSMFKRREWVFRQLMMFGIHADISMKSEGGIGTAWLRKQWRLHTRSFTASTLPYHIGLELLQWPRS